MVPFFSGKGGYGNNPMEENARTSLNQRKLDLFTGSINNIDYRAKTDMDWIGKSKSGLNIYEFSYNWDKDTRYQGVVAQELLNTKYEDSVVQMTDGYLGVDYSKLDVDFKQVT